jgi:tetratricopeptide (TPR) repeat protein
MAARDYEKALANLRQATGLRPNDPSMWVRYGDAHSKLAGLDHENMVRATACWRKALEIDPNNKDALQRMLTICQAQIEHAAPRELPTYISETRDYARKLVQADPSNLQVAAVEPQLTIRGWMNGIAAAGRSCHRKAQGDQRQEPLGCRCGILGVGGDASAWARGGARSTSR